MHSLAMISLEICEINFIKKEKLRLVGFGIKNCKVIATQVE